MRTKASTSSTDASRLWWSAFWGVSPSSGELVPLCRGGRTLRGSIAHLWRAAFSRQPATRSRAIEGAAGLAAGKPQHPGRPVHGVLRYPVYGSPVVLVGRLHRLFGAGQLRRDLRPLLARLVDQRVAVGQVAPGEVGDRAAVLQSSQNAH